MQTKDNWKTWASWSNGYGICLKTHGAKGPGIKSPWRMKNYLCIGVLICSVKRPWKIKELRLGQPLIKTLMKDMRQLIFTHLNKSIKDRLNGFKIDSRILQKICREKISEGQQTIADWKRFIKNWICPRDGVTVAGRSRAKWHDALAQCSLLESVTHKACLKLVSRIAQ